MDAGSVRKRTGETVVSSSETSNDGAVGASSTIDARLEEGKRLYQTAKESGFEKIGNLVRGVDNVVHAATDGSSDAVDWLKTFLVSPPTALDSLPSDLLNMMKIVVDGSEEEKEVCQVAKQMFHIMAKGKKEILQKEIDDAAQHLMTSNLASSQEWKESKPLIKLRGSVKRLMNHALVTNEKGIKVVTEEGFIVVACRHAEGDMISHSHDALDAEHSHEFKHANWIKKFADYPQETFIFIGQYLLRSVEKNGVRWIWSYFSMKNFFFLFFVYFLPMINISFILATLGTMVFIGSFLTMVIATIQVIGNSSKVYSLKEYWSVFQYFSSTERSKMDGTRPETRMIKQLVYPYATFVISALLALAALNNAHQIFLMHELLVFLSGALVLIVFIHFQCWKSPVVMLSLSIRFFSLGCVFLYAFVNWLPWSELLLSGFASIPVIPRIVSIAVGLGTVVLGSTHLFLVGLFALNASWSNFFFLIGPYMLLSSWSVFMHTLLVQCSVMNIVTAFIGLGVLVCMIPFTPLILIGAPTLYLMLYGSVVGFLAILGSMIIMGLAALAIVKNYDRLKTTKWLNIKLDYVIMVQILICIPLLVVAARYYNWSHHPSTLPAVELHQYGHYCGVLKASDGDQILRQAKCLALKGRVLHGMGMVNSIELGDIINNRMNAMARFPKPVQTSLTCLMGEVDPICKDTHDPSCAFSGCHFYSSNLYTLQLNIALSRKDLYVEVESNSDNLLSVVSISVTVHHSDLQNCSLLKLKSGDVISFNATFVSGMGSESLKLGLISLHSAKQNIEYVVTAGENLEEARDEVMNDLWDSLVNVIRFAVNVFCGYLSVN